jgi:hypothetical protein
MLNASGTLQLHAATSRSALHMTSALEAIAKLTAPTMATRNIFGAIAKLTAPTVATGNIFDAIAKLTAPTVAAGNAVATLSRLTTPATTMGGALEALAKLTADRLGTGIAWSAPAARRAMSVSTGNSAFAPKVSTSRRHRRTAGPQDLNALPHEGIEYLARNRAIIGFVAICLVAGASVAGSIVEKGWLDGQATFAMWLGLLLAYLGLVKAGAI